MRMFLVIQFIGSVSLASTFATIARVSFGLFVFEVVHSFPVLCSSSDSILIGEQDLGFYLDNIYSLYRSVSLLSAGKVSSTEVHLLMTAAHFASSVSFHLQIYGSVRHEERRLRFISFSHNVDPLTGHRWNHHMRP